MNKPRLVDANEFYTNYCNMFEKSVDDGEMDRMAYAISHQPTAYDIDKVVERLEEERDRPFADCDLTINGRPANDREITACKVGINYAIEIVKGGAE